MPEPKYLSYLFDKAKKNGVPLAGTFELTSRCNLDCKMCYIHRKKNDAAAIKKELSADKWIEIAHQACKSGTLLMLLTGGEPFVYSGFEKVYMALKDMGMLVSVNSNGTMIGDRLMGLICDNPPTKINISLYGASPETYEKLCGNGDMYFKVIDTIDKLLRSNINVKINYSVSQYNCADMEGIGEFAKSRKIDLQTSTYMFPPVRACEACKCVSERFSAAEAGEYMAKSLFLKQGKDIFTEYAKSVDNGKAISMEMNSCIERNDEQLLCRAGSCSYWVTFDGRMLPCGMFHEPYVSLDGVEFCDAWQELRKKTGEIKTPKQCLKCDKRFACEVCAASCYAETGKFDCVPEYQCRQTEAFIKSVKKLSCGG